MTPVPLRGLNRRELNISMTGIRKARVFPEPVLAAPRTSRPASEGGMPLLWISVILVNFISLMAFMVFSERFSSAKDCDSAPATGGNVSFPPSGRSVLSSALSSASSASFSSPGLESSASSSASSLSSPSSFRASSSLEESSSGSSRGSGSARLTFFDFFSGTVTDFLSFEALTPLASLNLRFLLPAKSILFARKVGILYNRSSRSN
ncbi:hypothetical protein FOYG_12248 [Fusarium oxysporum NRRL 32931]|uniref:Transmembrane protein n=1 Tax=Fusarium oxysporum NRRL 32931 TaxID=660029 RepID=W9HXD7_FUSOX|nr:hypothetical protein FOYG_12248 [Fusarium oxysporum NRRL 32931]EWY84891.1 hypothetical protein FOYG_12248 [Fusarium oxysporum NRRL 32931]EWY84892.1 hypothetical protein FOYG_12248 [Fusarium oxysporum NRRL 32931]EWY84893.1 hypothetical protein FOYG_12248 [Fusarium oxysporum NRRL 32931]